MRTHHAQIGICAPPSSGFGDGPATGVGQFVAPSTGARRRPEAAVRADLADPQRDGDADAATRAHLKHLAAERHHRAVVAVQLDLGQRGHVRSAARHRRHQCTAGA